MTAALIITAIIFIVGVIAARNARRMYDANTSIYYDRLRQMSKIEDM